MSQFGCKIASGGAAAVLDGKLDGDSKVVLKLFNSASKPVRRNAMHECRIAAQLDHPNMVKHVGWSVAPMSVGEHKEMRPVAVMHRYAGDLTNPKGLQLFFKDVRGSVRQLLAALVYLHDECGLMHRDIKPSNIFFETDGRLVLGDFGFMKEEANRPHSPRFSVGYVAPEVRSDFSFPVDIYSLGKTFYSIRTTVDVDLLDEDDSCFLETLESACCEYKPEDRPTAKQLMERSLEM